MEQLLKYKNCTDMLPEIQNYLNTVKKSSKSNRYNFLHKKFNRDENEKLAVTYRSILNKLSESNFNDLAAEIVNVPIKTQDQLLKLVDAIFQKAIMETKFIEVYAKLSKQLGCYHIEDSNKKYYFRELLINKCQLMFNEWTSLDPSMAADNILKSKVIGCITFIGELYKHEMLTSKIIYSCFIHLFAKANLNKAFTVDSICVLFKTVGKLFQKKSNTDASICLEKLDKLKNSPTIQLKEKFAIMDIFDTLSK
jgi:hypothetical protein